MRERNSRSGSSRHAAIDTAHNGQPNRTVPWHPPIAARPAVPMPPPPAPRRAAVTPRQGIRVSREPYDASIEDPDAEAEMTRAWRQHVGQVKAALYAEEKQEPTVTTSIKPFEIEEVREQLRQEQERKAASQRVRHPATVKTVPIETEPEESEARPRRSSFVRLLTPLAVLTFVCAVAYHHGYRPPHVDLTQLGVSQVDFQPLWSTLVKAKDVLRVEQDRLFATRAESPRVSLPQPAPAPAPVFTPVPIVEQLQVDPEEEVDVILPSSLGLSPEEELAKPIEQDSAALIEPRDEDTADEQASAPAVTPSKQEVRQSPPKRGTRALRGKGTLRVNSLPWAEIYVDGELLGHTPEMGLELPAGSHEVTLKNSEQNLLNTFVVNIQAGRVVTRIVHLREEPKPAAP